MKRIIEAIYFLYAALCAAWEDKKIKEREL